MLPNFFIAGAPKAGTTSLYHYLSGHPGIFMSRPKELNFFSGREIEGQKLYYKAYIVKDLEKYKDHFKGAEGKKAIGEASVSYLFYKEVPERIFELIPDAKIILVLRDPVKRAFSHYLMDERLGYIGVPFEEIVYQKKGIPGRELFYQQYVALGLYHDQVKRYLDTFGKDNVRVYFFDELISDPERLLEDLFRFLGVELYRGVDITERYNARLTSRTGFIGELYKSDRIRKLTGKLFPAVLKKKIKKILFQNGEGVSLNKKVELFLQELYDKDIKKLGELLSRDIPFRR